MQWTRTFNEVSEVIDVMELRSALPSINGPPDQPATRPKSSVMNGGRRALGNVPKSATSVSQRTRHSEVAMTSSWQSTENQAQRPSSTKGTSVDRAAVRVFTSTARHPGDNKIQQPDQHYKGFEDTGQEQDEVQQLRHENAIFRLEIDQLRTKLVEKMRGQSKVVAGGQFRAASASPSAKVSLTSSSTCTKCSTARAKTIKAHQESKEAQAATAELQKYVEKIEVAQHQLWDERSKHVIEITQLRDKLAEKVEECILLSAECAKFDKQQVKMLNPENDIAKARPKVEVVDNETQCSLQQRYDDVINAFHQREIVSLREEVQRVVQQLQEREGELEKVSKELEQAQNAIRLEKEQREHETRLLQAGSLAHKRRIVELEQTEQRLRVSAQGLQEAHAKELQVIEKANQDLHKDALAKEAAMHLLHQQHKKETSARENQQQTLVKALKVRIEQKVADVYRLHAMVKDHAAVKASNTSMKKQIRELEEQVQTLSEENATLTAANLLQQQEVAAAAQNLQLQIEREKLLREGAAEQLRLTEALSVAEQDNRSLQTRISQVEAEVAEHDVLMQRLKRSHARAMEKLLESSLRLCVVAPTVNVQLNTNGSNLASKTNNVSTEKESKDEGANELTSVVCRSTPQEDCIKRVIENDVLPLFTSVFLQGDDNASPQANIPTTRWLQDLLHDMQARIAAQLESIYSTSSVKYSE